MSYGELSGKKSSLRKRQRASGGTLAKQLVAAYTGSQEVEAELLDWIVRGGT